MMANHSEKHETKNRFSLKRGLSLFMATVLSLSLVQVTALADDMDQIMKDGNGSEINYIVGSNGKVAKDGEGNAQTAATTVSDNGFERSKTITQTDENQFNVDLQVSTSQTVTTNDAAVCLVIDTSGSMGYCAECGGDGWHKDGCVYDVSSHYYSPVTYEQSRMAAAITEATNFIDALQNGLTGSAGVYVSVVRFSGSSQSSGSVLVNWTKVTKTSDPVSASLTATNLYASGGTNTEAGLLLARNLYGSDTISSVAPSNRYTVLLTDGQPTAHCTSDHTTLDTIDDYNEGNGWNAGSKTNEDEYNETIAAATAVKAQSKLYTICYGASGDKISFQKPGQGTFTVTVSNYLANSIATSGCAYDASNTAQVHTAFSSIASTATTGVNGSGTQVVDPMGAFVNYVADSARVINGSEAQITDGVSAAGNTLTWTLDPASAKTSTSDSTTTYLYRMRYSITLNTAAEYFQEETYYPTNGYTYLQSGTEKYAFTVPAVSGTVPTVHYTVEYYKWDKATEDYPATATETSSSMEAKLWASVNAPVGYASKYTGDHYSFAEGSTQMTITGDGQIMKLCYTPDTATVTVNRHYRTDIINAAGVTTYGTYDSLSSPDQDQYTVYVGDTFPAVGQDITSKDGYTLVREMDAAGKVSDSTATFTVNNGGKTIDLYYVQVNDERAQVDVTYQKTYITNEWVINATTGRYELTETQNQTNSAEKVATGVRATTPYSYGVAGTDNGYDWNALTVNGDPATRDAAGNVNFTVTSAKPNTICATYTKTVDHRGDPVSVTVRHHYTLHKYESKDAGLVETLDPDNETVDVPVTGTYYAGETFKWSDSLYSATYEDHPYDKPTTDPSDLTLTADANVIDVYYTADSYPDEATFTVTNHYTTWVPEVDPDDGTISWVVSGTPETVDDHYPATDSSVTYYAGQTLDVPQDTHGHDGYTVDKDTSASTITLEGGSDNHADVYFDIKDGDEPQVGSIKVIHEYYQDVQCVKNGVVITESRFEGSTSSTLHGEVGEVYNITPVTSYDNGTTETHTYTRTDTNELTGSFPQAGTNDSITLEYTRTGTSELVETDLTVTHSYAHKVMTVLDGKADYYTDAVSDGTSNAYTLTDKNGNPVTTPYKGMKVTVTPVTSFGGNNYTESTTDNNTIKLRASGKNSVTLNYVREIPLSKVAIIVNHIYNLITYSYTGGVQSSETDTTYGTHNGTPAAEKYVGETYQPVTAPGDYTLKSAADGETQLTAGSDGAYTITAGENGNTVTFTYEKSEGARQAATVTVRQHYTLKDWNGDTDTTVAGDTTTLTGYVGLPYTAVPNDRADADGSNGYTLVNSTATNDFVEGYTITVAPGTNDIDLYFEKTIDSRVSTSVKVNHVYYHDADALAAGTSEGSYSETFTAKEFDSYTATLRISNDGLVYNFDSATPANYTITSASANASENVVTINYLRAETSYTVIHRYFNADRSVVIGQTVQTLPGKIGDVVASSSLERIPSFNGVTYAYVGADLDSITLVAPDGNETAQAIVLTYKLTQPVYDDGGGDDGDNDNTPVEIPSNPTPLSPTPVTTTEIPDGDVPQTEIPDEETPLAVAPAKTGDNLILWVLAAGMSGIGLVWVSLQGRKRKDESGSQN